MAQNLLAWPKTSILRLRNYFGHLQWLRREQLLELDQLREQVVTACTYEQVSEDALAAVKLYAREYRAFVELLERNAHRASTQRKLVFRWSSATTTIVAGSRKRAQDPPVYVEDTCLWYEWVMCVCLLGVIHYKLACASQQGEENVAYRGFCLAAGVFEYLHSEVDRVWPSHVRWKQQSQYHHSSSRNNAVILPEVKFPAEVFRGMWAIAAAKARVSSLKFIVAKNPVAGTPEELVTTYLCVVHLLVMPPREIDNNTEAGAEPLGPEEENLADYLRRDAPHCYNGHLLLGTFFPRAQSLCMFYWVKALKILADYERDEEKKPGNALALYVCMAQPGWNKALMGAGQAALFPYNMTLPKEGDMYKQMGAEYNELANRVRVTVGAVERPSEVIDFLPPPKSWRILKPLWQNKFKL